ncbi:hypothetical protein NLX71_16670 [Paenibacillus sp. MZ04-78.2]|uniref:hypothetical protein n=1 Tax=Paenibacillus sp. MZ04-78.2 TaxID=2962034 RepID=UPI0020B86006|nr:hypothetical protein [Paenibacillus sp. MZ04-78.2]MCP3774915.1 hypothetical protein [Paenibacillus sp. MZ04-78.2]
MLITAFVFIMVAVVIGIIFLRNFAQQLVDHEDHSHGEHPHHLKKAASIEAAQELYPFEETKSIARSKNEPDKKRSHIQAVPDIRENKTGSSVQPVTPKADAKAKNTVQSVTPKVDAKVKSTMQPVTPKVDAKAKSTMQTVTPKVDAKVKSAVQPVTPKVDTKVKSAVQPVMPKTDAKVKSAVQPVTPKVAAKVKSAVQPVTPKVDTKVKSTMQPFSYIQVPSNISASFIANEQPYQPVLSQSIDSAAVIPLSLEKQLDNIEVTESRLQINVYNNLVQQLEEASAVLAQVDEQIKFIELTNFIDDEFTKLRNI